MRILIFPLCKLYSTETALEKALKEFVWLKNGGYLINPANGSFDSHWRKFREDGSKIEKQRRSDESKHGGCSRSGEADSSA